ncbi:MAG TPA: hypothetical protein VFB20_03775 [Burkholderiales bacterium]|nr:hypothetical protein [Burkholderiales bacterium]
MTRLLPALVFALLAAAGQAARAQGNEEQMSRPQRSESLEIPGLTAGCHVCEWRPKLNQKPALQQCGADEAGNARIGVFECGFSEDCQRICNFLRCGTI